MMHADSTQPMDAEPGRLLRVTGLVESAFMAIEAWVGAVFTSLLCLLIGIPLLAAAVTAPFTAEVSTGWVVLFLILATLWLRFDTTHLYRTWSSVRRRDRPLAPAVAARQPPLAWPLRLVATVWMGGHFMMGLSFAVMTENIRPGQMQGPRPIGVVLLMTAMALAYTFASNGFLLVAVKMLTGSDRWVGRVSAWRLAIDLGIVALSAVPFSLMRTAAA